MILTVPTGDGCFPDEAVSTVRCRPCILVADDDDDHRALVARAMRSDGYDVIEARDGREVVHLTSGRRRLPDAIVADVRLPNVSGLSLLGGLRTAGCTIPIVLLTAQGVKYVRRVAGRLGADAVFAKPVDVDDLRIMVTKLTRPMTRAK